MFVWLTGSRRVYANEIDVIDGDSINWRRDGWGADGQQTDGAVRYRLAGYDSPELLRAKTESEAEWATGAKEYLKRRIARAGKMRLKVVGRTPHGDPVARLTIDGHDVKDIMIRK